MNTRYCILSLLLIALSACSCDVSPQEKQAEEARVELVDTLHALVMQVQQCSRLYTTEVRVHKVVTHDDVVRVRGSLLNRSIDIPLPLGDRKVAIPMDATLKAYVDLAEFSEANVERSGSRITIVLPDPKVALTATRINQQEVKEYVALTRSHFSDKELADYEQQGRQAILNSVADMGIIETARANAARVLVPLIVQMGYREEDITVAFRKDLDARRLFDSNIERR